MIDARYFYYWEELEWCVRAGKAGWKIVLVPQSKLWHKGVQRNHQPKPSVTYYATRNRLFWILGSDRLSVSNDIELEENQFGHR